jgi:hypothetical protein
MLQVHTCVSVHCDQCGDALGCDQCGDALGGLAHTVHYRTENAALAAAIAEGWRIGPDGHWSCSACAPALICQVDGHQFSSWRCPHTRNGRPAPSEYRYCRRCCALESRPATFTGDEPR